MAEWPYHLSISEVRKAQATDVAALRRWPPQLALADLAHSLGTPSNLRHYKQIKYGNFAKI